jgi:dolichyl-phosphate-mannose--protein O-mannosyl transferase
MLKVNLLLVVSRLDIIFLMKNYIIKNKYTILIYSLFLFAFLVRFWRLNIPSVPVFDEVYYPKWANEFIHGQVPFDVHPPFVKIAIALSEIIFGNTVFAWRFFSALFGSLFIILIYDFSRKLFKDNLIALFSLILVSFEGLYLVLSRIGILEMITIFFFTLSLYCFWSFYESNKNKSLIWLIVTGLSLGIALSCKWTNLAALGIIIVWIVLKWQEISARQKPWVLFLFLIVLPTIIYVSSFAIWFHSINDLYSKMIDWHKQTYNFHKNLQAGHPYASRWWSWPILVRPVWFYFNENNNIVTGIFALGNPLIWWGSLSALIFSIWNYFYMKIKNNSLLFCFLGIILTYLPWVFIKRIEFNYYFGSTLIFEILILSYVLKLFWHDNKKSILTYLILVVIIFLFFYPILMAYPISEQYYRMHLWFQKWI